MASQNLMAASSILPKILFSGQITSTSATTLYTAPNPGAAIVKHGTVCNTSGSAVTVTLRVVPTGGSADGTHCLISGYSLANGDTLGLTQYLDGCCLGPGDFISITVGTANVVDVVITGTEST